MNLANERDETMDVCFISGIMRSGTTLLQRIVAHSYNTKLLPEFTPLNIMVNPIRTLDQYNAYHGLSRGAYIGAYRGMMKQLLRELRDRQHLDKLVLKDPLAVMNIDLLVEIMDFAKFVLTVRNPLGTIASIYRVNRRQKEAGMNTFISNMKFEDMVDYVKRGLGKIASVTDKKNVLAIKYEDLIMRRESARAQLEAFLRIHVTYDLPDERTHYDRGNPFWTPESGGAITDSSLKKYTTTLNDDQIRYVIDRLSTHMETFGYGIAQS